jgi:hypothetical protein
MVNPTYVIPAGETSADFTVYGEYVTSTNYVGVDATYGGVTQAAYVTVYPPTATAAALISLNISPNTLTSGQTATVTMILMGPAPTGGALVSLSSSNATSFPVPSSYPIAAGQTGASFIVTAGSAANTNVTVSAGYGGLTQNAWVAVSAPAAVTLTSLSIGPSTIASGQTATVSLTLSGPAPTGGASVSVSSSDDATIPVPSSYTIAAGQTAGAFSVTAGAVMANEMVTVSAGYGGVTQAGVVTLTTIPTAAVSLISLSVSPSGMSPGGTSTAILTLSGPAPSGGAAVSLISSNSTAISPPSIVLITAGQTSGNILLQAGSVSAATQVSITATYGGASQSTTVTVSPGVPTAYLSPTGGIGILQKQTVATGDTVTVGLTLIGLAPPGGAAVSVLSSNPTALPVQAVYLIPAGQGTITFGVVAGPVPTATTVTLTANYGGVSCSASVIVTPAQTVPLSSVTVSPANIPSGGTAAMTLTLSGPAPDGDATVAVYSTGTLLLNTTYTIPAGQTSANFIVQAGTVSSSIQVVIYASYGGVTQTATVTVTAAPAAVTLVSLTISPPTLASGQTAAVTVTLSGPAPGNGSSPMGGASISLSSSNSTAFPAQSVYTIAPGQTSGSFSVTAGTVTANTMVTVSAGYGGVTQTDSVTVTTPAAVTLVSLSVSPSTLASGQTAAVTVTLSGPAPTSGASVSLYSNATAFPVPSPYVISAGQSSATVRVTAGMVFIATTSTVAASTGGTSRLAVVTVTPPSQAAVTLSSVRINPTTVTSAETVTLTLTLSGPAASGGASVALSSSDTTTFPVQASYLIPAGQTNAGFTLKVGTISAAELVTVGATYGNSQSAIVMLTPASTQSSAVALSTIAISPEAITSGGTATLSLTLGAGAPPEGALVSVSSGNSAALPLQSAYLIPAGQTSASFSVQAGVVSDVTAVAVSAADGGVSQVVLVTVTPSLSASTLASISISPATAPSESTATLVLALSGPAPPQGATIAVSSADVVTFPAQSSYLIPAGQSSAAFSVETGAVSAATVVSVSAAYDGATQVATLTVTPLSSEATLNSMTIDPATISSGTTAVLTLTLSAPAPPEGASVAMSTGDYRILPLPSSYLIPSGQNSVSFGVRAGTVSASSVVPVGGAYGGESQALAATVTPRPSAATLSSMTISPATVASGAAAVLTLTLTGQAPPEGASVDISGLNSATFPGPSSYLIPAGKQSTTLAIQAGPVSAPTAVPVGAEYGGSSQSAMVMVIPLPSALALSSITISPATVASGDTATVTLTLSGPAPPLGASVGISGMDDAAFPAASFYIIPAGQSSASFDVRAATVPASTLLTLGAGYGGATQAATITVTPPAHIPRPN